MVVPSVMVRFYEELNDYLPEDKKKCSFACRFEGAVTAARLLRALGVPIAEVDLILRQGEPMSPGQAVCDEDRISVYPVFESFDIKGTSRMRAEPLRTPRFVVGAGLERLAGYLRLLGFDTIHGANGPPEGATAVAEAEGRILLTRNSVPAPSSRAFLVCDLKPRRQVAAVLGRFDLYRLIAPPGRCPRCNMNLSRDGDMLCCAACRWIDHDGSHVRRMRRLTDHLTRRCT